MLSHESNYTVYSISFFVRYISAPGPQQQPQQVSNLMGKLLVFFAFFRHNYLIIPELLRRPHPPVPTVRPTAAAGGARDHHRRAAAAQDIHLPTLPSAGEGG